MKLSRAEREQEARKLGRDIEEFNEGVIEQVFTEIHAVLDGELDAETIRRNEERVCELHKLPYFYATASVGATGEKRVFTIDKLVSVALLFKAAMPEKYKELAVRHFIQAEFVQHNFEFNENIGVFDIYHCNKIVSWLVCVFHLATTSSLGPDFFSLDSGVMGMEVHMPYGLDVCLYKVKRASEYAYVVGFAAGMSFSGRYAHIAEELPMEAMDMHETLLLIDEYNCPKCKEGECARPDRHIQSFPIICANKDRLNTVTIDLVDTRQKGELRGELVLLNQWAA